MMSCPIKTGIRTIILLCLIMPLASCMLTPNQWSNENKGVVLGGTAGGVLGSTVGKGGGQMIAIGGGVVGGAIIGGIIGNLIDNVNSLKSGAFLNTQMDMSCYCANRVNMLQ